MKFIVSSKALYTLLKPLARVINHSTVLPILEDFLFQAKKGKLTVSATDLENYMSVSLDIEAKEKGAFCIDAKLLMQLLATVEDQPIVFSVEKESCIIQGDNFSATLPTEDAGNYPKCPVVTDDTSYTSGIVDAAEWIPRLAKALHFASNDDLRPAMTGVLIAAEKDKIRLAATDAHRLYWTELKKTAKNLDGAKWILPQKAVKILTTTLVKPQEIGLEVSGDHNHVFFYFGNYMLATRTIDAKYPDYSVVIPQHTHEFHLVRKEAIRFLQLVKAFSNKSTNQATLVANSKAQEVTLEAADLDFYFKANAKLRAYNFKGTIVEHPFAINAEFLLQAIRLEKDRESYVRIQHSGNAHQAVIVDNNILIMPLMLNE